MSWSDLNEEHRAAKNRRRLLGEILAGKASVDDLKLDSPLIGFQEIGTSLVHSNNNQMSVGEFQRRAAFHRGSVIFQEVEVKVLEGLLEDFEL